MKAVIYFFIISLTEWTKVSVSKTAETFINGNYANPLKTKNATKKVCYQIHGTWSTGLLDSIEYGPIINEGGR